MKRPHAVGFDLGWTRRNLSALIVICLFSCGLLAVRAGGRRTELGEPVPVHPARVRSAAEKINPNTATVPSLRRLPGIGSNVAQRIVDYRREHPTCPFRTPADLTKVKGIGEKTVLRIRAFLQTSNDESPTTSE